MQEKCLSVTFLVDIWIMLIVKSVEKLEINYKHT